MTDLQGTATNAWATPSWPPKELPADLPYVLVIENTLSQESRAELSDQLLRLQDQIKHPVIVVAGLGHAYWSR